jgi:transcriptional regulator with XRE-family HTH domain
VDVIRFGRSIRALRRRQRLRQSDVATRARVSQNTVSRIELGRVGRIPFSTLHAIGEAVDAEVELTVRWHSEGLDRLLDQAHAAIVDVVVRRLQALGYDVRVEVSFSIGRERGSIDILALHPGCGVVIVGEVKSVVPDIQSMIFSLDRKARLGGTVAAEQGWSPLGVTRILFVAESRTSRRRVRMHEALFAAAFPVQGRGVLAWLRRPTLPGISGLVFVAPTPPSKLSPTHPASIRQRHRLRRGMNRRI